VLNLWCSSTLVPTETDFDETMRKWNVTVIHGDETKHKFAVGHVVLATGLGHPKMSKPFEGQESFTGKIVHSGLGWIGKRSRRWSCVRALALVHMM
jgi:cation diffusion facilitator CzcD-associated flavoprotein CzcO